MRKYLSVLALDVRSSIYKIFCVLVIMVLTQVVDYNLVLQRIIEERQGWNTPMPSLENTGVVPAERLIATFNEVMELCHARWIFLMAVVVSSVIFIWSSSERGKSRIRRSLWRLRISRRQVFAVFCSYHIVVYLVLIAVQILLILWMHQVYQMQIGMEKAPQALFLAFYRNSFLHGIVPLSDGLGVFRLLSFVAVWGVGTTYIGYVGFAAHRNACSVVIEVMLAVAVILSAGVDLFWFNVMCILVSVISIFIMLLSVSGKMEVTYEGL